MPYSIQYSKEAARTLGKLDRVMAKMIVAKIEELAENPFIVSNVKSLKGNLKGLYRLRVGNYRILYQIIANKLLLLVLEIGDRKDIYR